MKEKPAVRLLAMDVDDTLLTDDLLVPPSAISAIAAARQRGVRVVLATGRMFISALPHARSAGVDGPIIAYNGGLVRTLAGQTLQHRPVPMREVLELIAMAEENDLCLNLYVDDRLYVRHMDERVEYYVSVAKVPAYVEPDLRKVLKEAPTKALIVGDPPAADVWRDRLGAHFGDRLVVAKSRPRFVEITAPGVCKGAALARLAASLGIERSAVMAIGDSGNDLDMLEFVGVSVAVGNARPDVKAQADYVVASNVDGGVAEAINRLILQ